MNIKLRIKNITKKIDNLRKEADLIEDEDELHHLYIKMLKLKEELEYYKKLL